jgi:adenylosuccinate synthase
VVGAGIGPGEIDSVIGVAKAYISRVGTGPFPTELSDDLGNRMVELGGEFGTVTGRRRRCGWLDLVALRYAVRVNGITQLFVTKLDILSHFPKLQIAVAYEVDGEKFTDFPRQQSVLYHCRPVYEDLAGWNTDISAVRRSQDLPPAARAYLQFIEEHTRVKIGWVSVGPERHQLIER